MHGIMRSFTSCQATDMDRLFVWFSLLLTYVPVTESMDAGEPCLLQRDKEIWRKMGQSAVLRCTVSSHCSAPDLVYEWFSFKEHSHLRLNLSADPRKYNLDGASLHIKSLDANDSGIYYCAASRDRQTPNSSHVGSGTTLTVKEKVKIMVRNILLWLSFVLLAIYSLIVVTLILKKYGCNMRRVHKTGKDNSLKKTQFRDVLQEMYSRRNMERGKQSVSRSRPQAEDASTGFNASTDDIYQNV